MDRPAPKSLMSKLIELWGKWTLIFSCPADGQIDMLEESPKSELMYEVDLSLQYESKNHILMQLQVLESKMI